MSKDYVEIVTFWKGGDEITYLLEDFKKYGDKAEPLSVRQHPAKSEPFVQFSAGEADGFRVHEKWDVAALRKLLAPQEPTE